MKKLLLLLALMAPFALCIANPFVGTEWIKMNKDTFSIMYFDTDSTCSITTYSPALGMRSTINYTYTGESAECMQAQRTDSKFQLNGVVKKELIDFGFGEPYNVERMTISTSRPGGLGVFTRQSRNPNR